MEYKKPMVFIELDEYLHLKKLEEKPEEIKTLQINEFPEVMDRLERAFARMTSLSFNMGKPVEMIIKDELEREGIILSINPMAKDVSERAKLHFK